MALDTVLIFVAAILSLVDLLMTRGRSLVGWAVFALSLALLISAGVLPKVL